VPVPFHPDLIEFGSTRSLNASVIRSPLSILPTVAPPFVAVVVATTGASAVVSRSTEYTGPAPELFVVVEKPPVSVAVTDHVCVPQHETDGEQQDQRAAAMRPHGPPASGCRGAPAEARDHRHPHPPCPAARSSTTHRRPAPWPAGPPAGGGRSASGSRTSGS